MRPTPSSMFYDQDCSTPSTGWRMCMCILFCVSSVLHLLQHYRICAYHRNRGWRLPWSAKAHQSVSTIAQHSPGSQLFTRSICCSSLAGNAISSIRAGAFAGLPLLILLYALNVFVGELSELIPPILATLATISCQKLTPMH